MSSENDEPKASTSKDENPRAPIFPCRNLQTFTAIEYPGKVEQQSVDKALDTLGGLSRLEEALSTQDETRSVVEMQLAPPKSRGNINFAHPVPAETVVTGNLVLKVTRRKRKKRQNEDGSEPPQPSKGIYTVESAGIVKRTLRFRALADFQYSPDLAEDPSIKLAEALRGMDVETFYNWKVQPPNEDYTQLHPVPPPVFSRLQMTIPYNYKPLAGTVPVTSTNSRGEEVTRLINQNRYKGATYATASFFSSSPVPSEAPPKSRKPADAEERRLSELILQHLEQRPMWTRMAMLNQMSQDDARKLYNHPSKQLFSSTCYCFNDGPFRDLVIRFGYDPRQDPDAKMYQRVMLRNSQNRRRVPEVNFDDETRRQRAHIFDGQHVYREVGNYQMCDITDPPLSKLLHRPEYCLSEPDERTGWWLPSFFENFRELLRRRFVGIINGQPIFDLELEEAMERLPDEEDVEAEKRLMRGESRRKAKQASTPASQPSASRAATRNTRDQVESQAGEHQEPSASTSANATAEQVGETEDDDAYQTSEPSSSEANNEEAALRPKRKSVFGRPTNKPKAKSRTSGAR